VKPVLGLARYAGQDSAAPRPLEVTMLAFIRGEGEPEMVKSLRDEGFALDVVRERGRFDFGVFQQLRAIVNKRQPDVLWTHGAKAHFLVRAARLRGERAWVAFHHGYTATSWSWTLFDQLDRWSLPGADRVMTACDAFAADLNRRLGVRRERLSVHRSPIAARASETSGARGVALRDELGVSPQARLILSVGRLSKEKGQADLLRAMREIRRAADFETVLVIVGDGPERARLEHLRARLGLGDAVRMAGYQHDVAPYYEAADVFVLTSYSEGSPNVLLEAMEARVPIVATAVGGVSEMIRDREHGLLVRSGDAGGIARAIVAALRSNDLRHALAAAAHRTLVAYAPEQYYSGVRSIFEELIGDDGRNRGELLGIDRT
jgi:glycosyltransferase involved in cell wall biosynthesis